MKKLIGSCLVLISFAISAKTLDTYSQIKTSVSQGKAINIVIDFNQCNNNTPMTQFTFLGVFSPTAFVITPHYITTSLNHFTLNNPQFRNQPIYEFVSYRISDNNIVKVATQPLDATNYKPLTDKYEIECPLNTAAKIYEQNTRS